MALALDAIAYGGANYYSGGGAASWTHVAASGATIGIVKVSWNDSNGQHISSVTWGGSTMSPILGSPYIDANFANQLYQIANPPSGSQTIVVTSDQANCGIAAVSWTATGSATSVRDAKIEGGQGTLVIPYDNGLGPSLMTVAGDLVLDAVFTIGAYGDTLTAGSGQTVILNDVNDPNPNQNLWASSMTASGTSTQPSWTATTDADYNLLWMGISLGPASGGGSSTPRLRTLMGMGI